MTEEDEALLSEKLGDPLWRLTSGCLYNIRTADGQGVIPFIPRAEQVELLQKLVASMYSGKESGNLFAEIKSRRLGYSTTIGVFAADCLLFIRDFTGTLIDQTQHDATIKLNGIVKVAVASAAEILRDEDGMPLVTVEKDNDSQLVIDVAGTGKSEFFASTKSRGGSNRLLWVSEWGPIQFEDAKRSEEIRSGALPSARHGVTIVETTWKGGKGGDLWDIIEPTISGSAADWAVHFTPWWRDPRNVSEDAVIDYPALAYFVKIRERLQRDSITLSERQQRWWAAERRNRGIFMLRENPTFLDECWAAPVEGAIYAEAISRAQAEGRICAMPIDGSNPVHTFWDLGSPKNTVVWYAQVVGREIRVIDCDKGFDGTATERVAMMKAKGYNFGKHYLPHDAQQTERSGETLTGTLVKAGIPSSSIVCVPRCHSIWVGINHALEMFPALSFNEPKCRDGLTALGAYHVKKVTMGSGQEPVHDWSSHASDAFRYLAEAHYHNLLAFKHSTAQPTKMFGGIRRGMRAATVSARG